MSGVTAERATIEELIELGARVRSHRVAYALANGMVMPDPELVVRHKCDNPRCIRAEHLELGTHKDNIADAVSRGRMQWQKGLTPEELAAQRVRGAKQQAAKLRRAAKRKAA